MKKTSRRKLQLKLQNIRSLSDLGAVRGGLSGLTCVTYFACTYDCSSWIAHCYCTD